jgi:hypothetical protein
VDVFVLVVVLPGRVVYELVEEPLAFGYLLFQVDYFFLKCTKNKSLIRVREMSCPG